jgi:hypothetical protein
MRAHIPSPFSSPHPQKTPQHQIFCKKKLAGLKIITIFATEFVLLAIQSNDE